MDKVEVRISTYIAVSPEVSVLTLLFKSLPSGDVPAQSGVHRKRHLQLQTSVRDRYYNVDEYTPHKQMHNNKI